MCVQTSLSYVVGNLCVPAVKMSVQFYHMCLFSEFGGFAKECLKACLAELLCVYVAKELENLTFYNSMSLTPLNHKPECQLSYFFHL